MLHRWKLSDTPILSPTQRTPEFTRSDVFRDYWSQGHRALLARKAGQGWRRASSDYQLKRRFLLNNLNKQTERLISLRSGRFFLLSRVWATAESQKKFRCEINKQLQRFFDGKNLRFRMTPSESPSSYTNTRRIHTKPARQCESDDEESKQIWPWDANCRYCESSLPHDWEKPFFFYHRAGREFNWCDISRSKFTKQIK